MLNSELVEGSATDSMFARLVVASATDAAIGTRFQDHELRLLRTLAPLLARGEAKFRG